MIRATTGGVLKSYRSNLMGSFTTLNKARDTVLSQRIFNSYAEDPATAAKAFKLRKSRMATQSQHNICSDTYRKYQTAWSCLDSVDKLIDTDTGTAVRTLKYTTLKALNDPSGDAREQLSKALDQMSETIVQDMNQKYGDNFIFAGADGHNVPFEVREIGGVNKLFYRGVDVDAAVPDTMKDAAGNDVRLADGSYVMADASTIRVREFKEDPLNSGNLVTVTDENGKTLNVIEGAASITQTAYDQLPADEQLSYVKVDEGGDKVYYRMDELGSASAYKDEVDAKAMKDADGNPIEVTIDGQKYYIVDDPDSTITEDEYNKACSDAEKLKKLANEKYFVDIGLGFQEDKNGNLIESSGYNASLVGLNFIGYGKDADGDPKNIYSIVQKLKDIAGRVKDGQNWTEADYDEFDGLVKKLERASSEFKTAYTNMDASTTKLKNNVALLEDNFYNLREQYSELEDVDMADSITSFVWAQYCYNAALKVGNSILSESLMDYLR